MSDDIYRVCRKCRPHLPPGQIACLKTQICPKLNFWFEDSIMRVILVAVFVGCIVGLRGVTRKNLRAVINRKGLGE